ncbi:hypothetical protein [Tsukamurella sp. 1534]|uniref:hypothetical protein n=1 Tax=Tsukamurella sp. 1534 TaxID=1151061 RepID=UPI0002EC2218|nr:hypothetical protein [Tsukamurella sp. 1534]
MTKRLGWLIGGAVALVLVVAVAAGVLVARVLMSDGARPSGGPSGTPVDGRCGLPGASSTTPITDRVTAGPVSFPVSAAPGWTPQRYVLFAPGAQSVGLRQGIPGQKWDAHAEIGLTTFAPRLPVAEAARRMIPCIVDSSRYDSYGPRLEGLTEPEAITVDGVPAARVTGRILVRRAGLSVVGDVVTVVVIDSAPQAYFESDTPIGDEERAAVARQIFEQLKVARDV